MSVHIRDNLSRDCLTDALADTPSHMRHVLIAVRDYGVGWAVIPQKIGRFNLPKGRPVLAILDDDINTAMGPPGFHRRSVRRLIASASIISIVSAAPEEFAYAAPARIATIGLNGLIIETRPEQEMQWIGLVKAENPHAQLILVSKKETAQ